MNKLKYKVEDLVYAANIREVNVIAHQCNCFCRMKSGIAPQIAETFPEAEEADNETGKGNKDKLGGYSSAMIIDHLEPLWVYNLYGQYRYGRGKHTDYDSLRAALSKMSDQLTPKDKIGLPMLGAGLGGGNWSVIEAIIKETLVNKGLNVTIYKLK